MKTTLLTPLKQKGMLRFVSGSFMFPQVFLQFRQKKPAFLCLLLLSTVFPGYKVAAQSTGYVWKNAPVGGGGFVTGIVTHKTSGDRYCRTDVGGAYRWDAANNRWIQLLDWINESENGFIGVEALALDPQNANNVYMLCGTSYINNGRTAILKSTDKGNTFTYTDVTAKFKAHGNGNGRGNGERLAVDPKNSNILFCGTRANGLWKSTDAGVTWSPAWNGVTTTPNENGICFVIFDPSSAVVGGATQTMYIGISRTGSANIYKSTDGGATFTPISATTSFMPHRAALQGTTMYVTYSDDAGPQSVGGDGKLYKLNTATGVWTNVTPVHSKDYAYGGVSIDPTNVNRVIVSTCGMYWNNQFGTGWGDFIFLSTDGGSTWTLKNGTNATYDSNGIGWTVGGAVNWMDCIEFDQSNLSKVRVIGGGGVYTCSDITAANPSWKYDVIGIEETALLDGISIPGGPFISSFGDVTGFVHEPLTVYPVKRLSPSDYNNHSIAYAAGNTNKVVRIGNGGNVVYYSNDKGASWTGAVTNKGASGRVAVSADGGTILHCPGGSATTYYTTNNGANWFGCSGVSLGDAAPVADQVNSNYFYIYNPTNGQMLRSSNKGVSFSVAGTPGASTANHPWEPALIRTVPGFEGHVWVPLGRNGLKYATNYGATYTTVSSVTYCKTVGIGKAMPGASYPTVFIWGTVSGVTGLFRSTDQGATWTRMNDDAHQFAGAPLLIGDMNVAGRVYMSAGGGRGLIYWEPAACTPTAITPYVNINNGTWQQAANAALAAGGSVQFGPQPVQGGSWSWSGPNNFSATTREVYISNVQSSQAGNYVATYTNSGGCKSTQTFNITLTGSLRRNFLTGMASTSAAGISPKASINEDAVNIYPNPASEGRFTILLQEIPEHAIVRIYDNQGRMLYEKKTDGGNKIEINSRLNAGFYIVAIDSNGSGFTKKLIVH
ncbi:T9SS type A sorting domain-containing protein [Chitinophaga japonensis]|nr:T9SS type A sorting domain-containing protein [Chitinophaga japonensis]